MAQPLDNSLDVQTYIMMLLCTDRVAPQNTYGIQPYQRRGSWHDTYVSEFGALFWIGTEMNRWSEGSRLGQIQRWAEVALQPLYDEAMILEPAQIGVQWVTNESVQIDVNVTVADGVNRAVSYVLGIG